MTFFTLIFICSALLHILLMMFFDVLKHTPVEYLQHSFFNNALYFWLFLFVIKYTYVQT